MRVGFVGLGHMGVPMTARLVEAGHEVRGFDVDPAARARAGPAAVESLPEAAAGVDVVVLMLATSAIVRQVVLDEGLLDAVDSGALVVDMGSSDPNQTRELAAEAAQRGVRYLDAPVSGGVVGAEAGTLTIMAGGSEEDLDSCRPDLRGGRSEDRARRPRRCWARPEGAEQSAVGDELPDHARSGDGGSPLRARSEGHGGRDQRLDRAQLGDRAQGAPVRRASFLHVGVRNAADGQGHPDREGTRRVPPTRPSSWATRPWRSGSRRPMPCRMTPTTPRSPCGWRRRERRAARALRRGERLLDSGVAGAARRGPRLLRDVRRARRRAAALGCARPEGEGARLRRGERRRNAPVRARDPGSTSGGRSSSARRRTSCSRCCS